MSGQTASEAAGALLVQPGLASGAAVVPLPRSGPTIALHLQCELVELWPYQYQLDTVRGPKGRQYRFDVWVDEAGAAAGRPANICASLAAHPFNEFLGRLIAGPALLIPLLGGAYTLSDWDQICGGVWSLECDCEHDCEQDPEKCPRVALVEANLAGQLAAEARI